LAITVCHRPERMTREDTARALEALRIEHPTGPPRGRTALRRFAIPALLLVGTATLVVLYVVSRPPEVATARSIRTSDSVEAQLTTANGYVRARTRASVASEVQGRLVQVLVDEGDRVTKGQLLAEVWHAEEDARIAEAEANVASARAAIATAAAETETARAAIAAATALLDERKAAVHEAEAVLRERGRAFERADKLLREGIVNDATVDDARQARDVAVARRDIATTALATAESALAQARAEQLVADARKAEAEARVPAAEAVLRQATARRDNAFIRAPFDGMVLRRDAEPGEVVSPANTGGAGSKTAVVTLADFSTLEIEVDVYERDIGNIDSDKPCRIVLDGFPNDPQQGRVRLVRPTADRTRATVQVYVAFATLPPHARPEMGARVTFYRPGTDALAVEYVQAPAAAIVERDGTTGVFVVTGDTATFRTIDVGARSDDVVRVTRGLDGDETLVLRPDVRWPNELVVAPKSP
jgi:RND family efflux transporter MFP subunit